MRTDVDHRLARFETLFKYQVTTLKAGGLSQGVDHSSLRGWDLDRSGRVEVEGGGGKCFPLGEFGNNCQPWLNL